MMRLPLSEDTARLNPGLTPRKARREIVLGGYRSQLEKRAALDWCPAVFAAWDYEAITFHLDSGSYKPDFFGTLIGGGKACVEVKGWNKNMRADKLKFRGAVAAHGDWCSFVWLEWKPGTGWIETWAKKVKP